MQWKAAMLILAWPALSLCIAEHQWLFIAIWLHCFRAGILDCKKKT